MRVLLAPTGSHGDVHPFVGLGVALKARGHEVHLIAGEPFRHLAADAGFDDFAPTETVEQFDALTRNPDLWHPTRAIKALFGGDHYRHCLRAAFGHIKDRFKPGETVVLAGILSHGARVANEALGVPLATVQLQPMALWSVENPARYGFAKLSRYPRFVRRFVYWTGDVMYVDRLAGPALNAFRKELGLPPVRRIFSRWTNSPQRVIGLFPEWFGTAPDWPPQTRLTGFVRYDQAGTSAVPREVEEFLADGEPPIIFTFGSAMRLGGRYFAAAVDACRRLGKRGLLIARGKDQIPPNLPPTVMHAEYAPFSAVFPRAAAVVHHGGVGTCAQALAAGVPQLVMALAHDQPDNGDRLTALGVGRWLWSKKFTGKRAARELSELLASPTVPLACAEVKRKMTDDALPRTCALVEALGERGA